MLFPEDDAPVLKDWIVKRLENTLVTLVLHRPCLTDVRTLSTDLTPTPMYSRTTYWPSYIMPPMV